MPDCLQTAMGSQSQRPCFASFQGSWKPLCAITCLGLRQTRASRRIANEARGSPNLADAAEFLPYRFRDLVERSQRRAMARRNFHAWMMSGSCGRREISLLTSLDLGNVHGEGPALGFLRVDPSRSLH